MTANKKKANADFPIIGIGASAGGLNSLECFIAALPGEFGFAVVFVQHLSTKHKSLLSELLHSQRPDLHIEYRVSRIKDRLQWIRPTGQTFTKVSGISGVQSASSGW